MRPLIQADQITKVYAGPPTGVTALSRVSLAILPGELVVIAGVSGSGKTTLLNMLGCLDRPSAGRVLIEGIDTGLLSHGDRARLRGERIGFVFQQNHLIRHMTVLENVMLPFVVTGCQTDPQRAMVALGAVGLAHHGSRRPAELSGGEQQRVAVARALVRNPDIILADEPTGSLDQQTGTSILKLLSGLVGDHEGRSLVIVTHQPELICGPQRRFRLVDGKLEPNDELISPTTSLPLPPRTAG